MISVKPISAVETVSIRHSVLRAGQPVETCSWDRDSDADTFHLGGYLDGRHVGVCTFQREPFPGEDAPIYRLRGMAVLPEARGEGVGALMLAAGEDRVRNMGVPEVWCDARIGAVPFYQKCGWEIVSGLFEIEGVGPHHRMRRNLTSPQKCGR